MISVGDQVGVVETIHLRTTQLRTGDGKRAILPNLSAFSQPVVNSSAFPTRRFAVTIWVPRETGLREVVATARAVLQKTPEVAKDPAPSVILAVDQDGNWTAECRYWLDYRAHDPDAVQALVAERLQQATGGAAVSDDGAGAGGESAEPADPQPPPVTDALTATATPPPPSRQRLRRALRERL